MFLNHYVDRLSDKKNFPAQAPDRSPELFFRTMDRLPDRADPRVDVVRHSRRILEWPEVTQVTPLDQGAVR
jgi:hypothetical protein